MRVLHKDPFNLSLLFKYLFLQAGNSDRLKVVEDEVSSHY